ncbi:MAG: hypothetical protein V7767_16320, partial [Leeuwenhoekiella sp.]
FPSPTLAKWVKITNIKYTETLVEFTVKPSEKPPETGEKSGKTKHLFRNIASSTFRIQVKHKTLYAFDIGQNEAINNKGEEEGIQKVGNTLIAEVGEVRIQQFHWKVLTDYLVHKIEF